MTGAINTHGLVCDFGKHSGELYTRLPVSYLKWMVQIGHSRADIAEAELARRGTVTPEVDVSGHAIDSASLRGRKIWHETRGENEGLHAWLCRMAAEARALNDRDAGGRYLFAGMKFAFEEGAWPVLKTVMRQ
jgi:uncharacterized protein (DUF3820 family)